MGDDTPTFERTDCKTLFVCLDSLLLQIILPDFPEMCSITPIDQLPDISFQCIRHHDSCSSGQRICSPDSRAAEPQGTQGHGWLY
jgi:hypothetical protein